MSAWVDEERRELLARSERLRFELARLREERDHAMARRIELEKAAKAWGSRMLAVTENFQKRIRHLKDWTDRLGSERTALQRERTRLVRENEALRAENLDLKGRPPGPGVAARTAAGEGERRSLYLLS